jgi:hypothetical protein
MRMMSQRWHPRGLVGGAVLIVATACASPTVSVAPSPSTQAAADACEPIDISTTSGERVDLTGTWQQVGDGPLYYVSQDADCVWIAGAFVSAEGSEPFSYGGRTFAFDGHLRPDLTVQGRWFLLLLDDPGQTRDFDLSGMLTLDVEVDPWTLRGELRSERGTPSLTLEKIDDRWVAP